VGGRYASTLAEPGGTVKLPTSCDVTGGVATITLDLPEKRNALTTELLDSLGDQLLAARADQSVRAVVLTHTGTTFCAGADLSVAGATKSRYDIAAILRAIEEMEKPVVGRIAGLCLGGGVGLAAVCDISIASTESRFGFSEVRLGVAPAVISVVCLPKMRRADASELFLSGERIDAGRAVAAGLINRAVDPDELDDAVRDVLDRLLLGGPSALAAVKLLISRVPAMDRDEAFAWASELSASLFASPEATEGIAALKERRAPSWAPGGRHG
jgi:methylglutaconyl-CoA hydratase